MIIRFAIILCTLSCFPAYAQQQEPSLNIIIRKVLDDNMEALNKKNKKVYLKTLHSKGPIIQGTEQFVDELFKAYDLKYEILDFEILAQRGEYVYASVRQKTTKIKGSVEFKNNILRAVQALKREGTEWKLWNTMIVETEFIP